MHFVPLQHLFWDIMFSELLVNMDIYKSGFLESRLVSDILV